MTTIKRVTEEINYDYSHNSIPGTALQLDINNINFNDDYPEHLQSEAVKTRRIVEDLTVTAYEYMKVQQKPIRIFLTVSKTLTLGDLPVINHVNALAADPTLEDDFDDSIEENTELIIMQNAGYLSIRRLITTAFFDVIDSIEQSYDLVGEVDRLTVTFAPIGVGGRSLHNTNYKPQIYTRFMKSIIDPKNSDSLCLLHCIHLKLKLRGSIGDEFNDWFNEHRLEEFTINGFFNITKLEQLEERLKINLNIYLVEDKEYSYYYNSQLKFPNTYSAPLSFDFIDVVLVGYHQYYNTRNEPFTDEEELLALEEKRDDFFQFEHKPAKDLNGHFWLIKFDAFFKVKASHSLCKICKYSFQKQSELVNHYKFCVTKNKTQQNNIDRIASFKENDDDSFFEFNSWSSRWLMPFCTYDFETRVDNGRHVALSYGITYVNIFEPNKSYTIQKFNQDAKQLLNDFIVDVSTIAKRHNEEVMSVKNMPLENNIADECKICLLPMTDSDKSTAEFNHSHGLNDEVNNLNGYVHKKCNRSCKQKTQALRFWAHNSSKFDNNLVLEALLNNMDLVRSFHNPVAKTASRFTELSINFKNSFQKVAFNDSLCHLQGSLVKLIDNFLKDDEDYYLLENQLQEFYPKINSKELLKISKLKAPFPYKQLSNPDAFNRSTNFSKEDYFDDLSNTAIKDEQYEISNQIWNFFKRYNPNFTFKDYHDFYLLLDSVLLASVLLNYQNGFYRDYKLNPLAFLSNSSAARNSCLFISKMKIKLPAIPVMLDLKKSIQGGVTFSFNRRSKHRRVICPTINALKKTYSQIKNPQEDFKPVTNPFIKDNLISFFDASSLYPHCYGEFKIPTNHVRTITDPKECKVVMDEIINTKYEDHGHYYFVELTVNKVKKEDQQKAGMFPCFQTNVDLDESMLSAFQLKSLQSYSQYIDANKEVNGTTKNTFTFNEVQGIWLQSPLINFMANELNYSFKDVTKIHQFEHDFVIRDFKRYAYQFKQFAKTDMFRGLAKLVLNSLYGSFITNSLLFNTVKFINANKATKRIVNRNISCPFVKSIRIVNNETLVINSNQKNIGMTYPLMIGSATLCISKLVMVRFVNRVRDILIDEFKIDKEDFVPLLCDTDSFCFQLENSKTKYGFDNVFDLMKKINPIYYERHNQHIFDCNTNPAEYRDGLVEKGIDGAFTYDYKDVEIDAVITLAPKAYIVKMVNNTTKIRMKGVSQSAAKDILSFETYDEISKCTNYQDLSFNNKVSFNSFKSDKFLIKNITCTKVGLSNIDMKVKVNEDGTFSYFGQDY